MQEEHARQEQHSYEGQRAEDDEGCPVWPCHVIKDPGGGGTNQGGHGKHEHADPQGHRDVGAEDLEDDNDAGVIGANTEAKQDSTDHLAREGGPQLHHQDWHRVDKEDDGGEEDCLVSEVVQGPAKYDLANKVHCSGDTEEKMSVVRGDVELVLSSVSQEGECGEHT